MPKPTGTSIPLHLHTLETLCDALVSGHPVGIDDGKEFRLVSKEARSIFNWYLQNKLKWAGTNKIEDVKKLAEQLKSPPPTKPIKHFEKTESKKRCLHLKRVSVHRFGGIHRYGTLDRAPKDFEHNFDKPVTLLEGKNGSGKTSLLNAIVWCLTGHIYRSQRPPETIDSGIDIFLEESDDVQNSLQNTATAITPIPDGKIFRRVGNVPFPLDTWVELTFDDDDGKEVGTLKRSLTRTPRGKIQVESPVFSSFGLDPIAWEIGTKMPGLIPYIQLRSKSDLGKALTSLTGIRPLEDLVKHARKSKEKLEKELPQECATEISQLDDEFKRVYEQLKTLIQGTPGILPPADLQNLDIDKNINNKLKNLRRFFEKLHSEALQDCQKILGEGFDANDQNNRTDILENAGKALGLLDTANLTRLSSAKRLIDLKSLTDQELINTENLIKKLFEEAKEIEALSQKPDHAARERLYAQVAIWIKEHKHETTICPICTETLDQKKDKVTGKRIVEHIKDHLSKNKDYLAKTLVAWGGSCERLLAGLPNTLYLETTKDLPEKPSDLIYSAFGEELFESAIFQKSLLPLKNSTQEKLKKEIATLPEYEKQNPPYFSDTLLQNCNKLCKMIERVNKAISFARWRKSSDNECKKLFTSVIGTQKSADSEKEHEISKNLEWSLMDKLNALQKIVNNATPVTEALIKVKALRNKVELRRKNERKIKLYSKAATAIDSLLEINKLVELQVNSLIKKLSARTIEWKKCLYQPAFIGAPEVIGTEVTTDGSIEIEAKIGNTRTSAHHISNSSDLRATLLALLLAFWEYLLKERGGISLILLDDLQELFDKNNRRRLANSIPQIVEAGGKLVVTTNDHIFGRRVAHACGFDGDKSKIDRFRVHPLTSIRDHIELGLFVEEIEAKRKEFEKPENENKNEPAQEYINKLRIYIEEQLTDFFNDVHPGVPTNPTLSDLINALKSRQKAGQEVFCSEAFKNLLSCPDLQPQSAFVDLMNRSHHSDASDITYKEVSDIRGDCIHVRKLVDQAHEEYELWMQRDFREQIAAKPSMPQSIKTLNFNVPLLKNLAAATSEKAFSQTIDEGDKFSNASIGEHAIYVLNTNNFGFAATKNYRVIVGLDDRPIADNSLVIALHGEKVYARRLLRYDSDPTIIGLSTEVQNPLDRPLSLLLPAEEVRLLPVIGIIFDNAVHWPKVKGEAGLVENYKLNEKINFVCEVQGDSGLPLTISGQKILVGDCLLVNQLNSLEGTLVAIDYLGGQAFKRIGKSIPGLPYLRLFESIGGLGESILLKTEEVEDARVKDIPLLQKAYKVIGVLYEQAQ